MKTYRAVALMVLLLRGAEAPSNADPAAVRVRIQVDATRTADELNPVWRFFGADEPNYAYMTHGQTLLGELGELDPGRVYFRAHNLLTSGDGTAALKWGSTGVYQEDAAGRPQYHWTIVDRILDAYQQHGLKPYVEIGFMPKELSTKPEPYQHHWNPELGYHEIFTGWAYPPNDYGKWSELVFSWAKHCAERYGMQEVLSWYWEVWNEPNIGYWQGSFDEFMKLHDFAIDSVRRAIPGARVGGADTAGSGGSFTRRFLDHCLRGTNFATGKIGTPLDFVSFHAKGAPVYTNGHVRMGLANQLRAVDDGFRIIASYPELQRSPVIIGECDPEGCAACRGPQLAYRNGTMYASYTAASFPRICELARRRGVNLQGALTWAFEFEDQPNFAGFRSLASNGIDKPVLNVFRMFSKMHGSRLTVESNSEVPLAEVMAEGVQRQADVSAVASLDANKVSVLIWHYHDDDMPGPAAEIDLLLTGLPAEPRRAALEHYRIDDMHSNGFTAWQRLGSPQSLSAEERAQLEQAARLSTLGPVEEISLDKGQATLHLVLPRQAVSLLQLSWR
jgi:xylan 1,4-beta-xylosidase